MGIDNNLTSFKQDIYNRKTIAENLTKIMEAQSSSLVMSIDSAWGTGKTTFVTMWKDLLDNDESYNTKFKTLYFNAWEHDYIKDPLISIICEIEAQIKEEDGILKQKFDTAISKLKPLAKFGITSLLKVGTAGFLDLKDINFGDLTEEQLVDIVGQVGDLSIKEVASSKKVRENFKQYMNEYQQESGKKIVFFIDELDRCRPTFAIELLEVIKHLFDIENFVFIISIDKDQLSHSVSTVYGQGMDTIGYLRRFFDLDYRLPSLDIRKYIDNKNQTVFESYKNIDIFKVLLKEFFIKEQFSLRDIDKSYYYINILMPLIDIFNEDKNWKSVYIVVKSYLYAILIVIKLKNPIIYKNIIMKDYKVDDIINEFEQVTLNENGMNIAGFHPKVLNKLLMEPILGQYLKLNLEFERVTYINSMDEDEYTIGIKDENGSYYYDSKCQLTWLFKDGKSTIHNDLEFIEGFNQD